jgi:hypothetical protein
MFYLQLIKKKGLKSPFFLNYIDNYVTVTVKSELSNGTLV